MDGMLSNRRLRARKIPYLNAFSAVWLGLLAFSGVFWLGVFWVLG